MKPSPSSIQLMKQIKNNLYNLNGNNETMNMMETCNRKLRARTHTDNKITINQSPQSCRLQSEPGYNYLRYDSQLHGGRQHYYYTVNNLPACCAAARDAPIIRASGDLIP